MGIEQGLNRVGTHVEAGEVSREERVIQTLNRESAKFYPELRLPGLEGITPSVSEVSPEEIEEILAELREMEDMPEQFTSRLVASKEAYDVQTGVHLVMRVLEEGTELAAKTDWADIAPSDLPR